MCAAAAGELDKLVAQHEKSKKDLVKPVKEMIASNPSMKKNLMMLTGLLSDACPNEELRAMFVASSKALSAQDKIVEQVRETMQYVQIAKMILEEKKAEEAKKRGAGSSTMDAAAALLGGSVKKPKA